MVRTLIRLTAALVVAIAAAGPVSAQEMPLGTWTGTMSPPGDQSVSVTYDVTEADGALAISMSAAEVGQTIAFDDVRLDGNELTFWWEPGVRVDCTLARRDDGSFEGVCTDGSGADGEGRLLMVPPTG